MKKTFIAPAFKLQAMESSQMICASTLEVVTTEQKGGSAEAGNIQAGSKQTGIYADFSFDL